LYRLALLLLLPLSLFAQFPGGQSSYAFLNLPTHSRVAALGGLVASASQPQASFFLVNPALLDSTARNQAALTLAPYLADTRFYTLQYGLPTRGPGRWAAGLQYLSYGRFALTDPSGNSQGNFTANDYALSLTHARTEGNFTLGLTAKAVGSAIEAYSSFAFLFDAGIRWQHPTKELSFGLVARNLGFRIREYVPGATPPDLPFDLRAGVTLKPQYLPIRASLTAHHLQRFDIAYNDPNQNQTFDLNGNPITRRVSVPEKLARHLAVGLEFLVHKNAHLLLGYNHQRRQEGRFLRPDGTFAGGASGLTVGLAVQARGFQLAYARALYAPVAGGSSHLTIGLDLNRFLAKK